MRQGENAERTDLPDGAAELPDPLTLDLESLREADHPVLAEVLEGLRTRLGEPTEILWGFNSAF
ncbi:MULTISPECIES: FxSxx-COOH cyclophane-containing RiPP peptide [unclassified Streptomyces]|uniref:FxSxx-COOH cyclophane-containing RiPP peptide n=1 Tax=unclassified Streptomyces TaxID=2593676 RepID=UPI0020342A6A|nr:MULTISPECIES: FxSxx-COOH cyclophane-containing RiPP peptide [unclassified Streptomyces]MCM2421565.1 FxSxx-COOH protein [Streptomyces sp. RKAG293]MCM2426229.1 FxSxx-COOH protein [Streptomyces sp. RKAG337]